MNPQPAPKWYETTWFAIVALVLLPPVGLYFLWRYTPYPSNRKWQISGAAMIWFFFVNRSGSPINKPVSPPVNNSPSVALVPTATRSKDVAPTRIVKAPTARPEPSPKPTARVKPSPKPPKRTAKNVIQGLMEDQFGDRLREAKVTSLGNGLYDVQVEFNNSLRLTARATKGYMEGDMKDAYKNIYNSGFNVVEASMEAYGESTDRFGNISRAPAYHTVLEKDVASKVNWSNYRAVDWDNLWSVIFIHRQYRTENLDRDWDKEAADAKKSFEPAEVEKYMREQGISNPSQ